MAWLRSRISPEDLSRDVKHLTGILGQLTTIWRSWKSFLIDLNDSVRGRELRVETKQEFSELPSQTHPETRVLRIFPQRPASQRSPTILSAHAASALADYNNKNLFIVSQQRIFIFSSLLLVLLVAFHVFLCKHR